MAPKRNPSWFTPETGAKARSQQTYEKLLEDNQRLQGENERLILENTRLKRQIADLLKIKLNIPEDKQKTINISPIVLRFIGATWDNITKFPQGRRYDGLHEFFALLSMMSPHYFNILNTNLLFPTYKTASTYRKQALANLGIHDDIFNGDIQNILNIMSRFLPNNFTGKGVIMVDAAYVTPYVKVNKNGRIDGVLNLKEIDPELAETFINDDNEFLEFIKLNYNSVIQAEFGMTFAPLNPEFKQFPIACIPSTSGKATQELREKIESIISLMPKNISIIGLGTDGDNTYSIYANIFIDKIIGNFERFLSLGAVGIIKIFAVLIHFSDPLHLTKRDRYRKSSLEEFLVSPYDSYETRSAEDLKTIGIAPYLLDNNKGRKMEDDLPKKLFTLQTIQKIIDDEDFYLLLSMLPSTLLLEALFRNSLSRQETIDYLLLGASIVLIYYLMQQYVIEHNLKIYRVQPNTYKKMRCFTDNWCKQYIFTAIGIASQIITEEAIDTGACSSHYQEHNFANVRRHNKKDDSHVNFQKSMKYILLEHELYKNMPIEEKVPESRSDSGKKIFDNTPVEERPIIYYLRQALYLWKNVQIVRKMPLLKLIDPKPRKMPFQELSGILGNFYEKNRRSISTKSTGMIKTAGLNNMIFWNADEQLNNLVNDDDSE